MIKNIMISVINAYKHNPAFMALLSLKVFLVVGAFGFLLLTSAVNILTFFFLSLAACKDPLLYDIADGKRPNPVAAMRMPAGVWRCIYRASWIFALAVAVTLTTVFINATYLHILIIPIILLYFYARPFDITGSFVSFKSEISDLKLLKNIKFPLAILSILSAALVSVPPACLILAIASIHRYFTEFSYLYLNYPVILKIIFAAIPALSAAVFVPLRGVILAAASHELSRLAVNQAVDANVLQETDTNA